MDTWDDTTTLYITVYEGESDQGAINGKGILRIEAGDFAIQMQTMEVLRAKDRKQQMEVMREVGMFFGGTLFETYGPIAAKPNRIDASRPVMRKKRPLRMKAPELYWVKTSDGTMVRLTRYGGGGKGPVMMSPGFGVSTLSFSTDTIDTNLPEYLYAHGYDVWLFDYRASPELASAATGFTLDDIARKDYPAAVQRVREVTGAETVQMIAHCIGSMTFLMAMMAGLEGVRSAICSQLGLFPVTSTVNEVKAGLTLGHFLTALGETTVNTNLGLKDWRTKLAEAVIQMFPRQELCTSSVCHQVRLIYGESYKHEQLNQATHDALHEMFGVANLETFKHILTTIRKGQVVDKDGKDVYLPQVGRLKIPIALVQGADNQLFLPEGTRKTLRYLAEKNGARPYVHIQFPNYAHMDLFVGKNAVSDIYPTILLELEKTAQPAATIASGAVGGGN
jgi:cholesterol oxidase